MPSLEGCAVAMAPSPSYLPTAFPKSVNARATHDGEGAVATGQTTHEDCDPPVAMAPSPSYLPTAFPKSVNARATHDGEGAVATGADDA